MSYSYYIMNPRSTFFLLCVFAVMAIILLTNQLTQPSGSLYPVHPSHSAESASNRWLKLVHHHTDVAGELRRRLLQYDSTSVDVRDFGANITMQWIRWETSAGSSENVDSLIDQCAKHISVSNMEVVMQQRTLEGGWLQVPVDPEVSMDVWYSVELEGSPAQSFTFGGIELLETNCSQAPTATDIVKAKAPASPPNMFPIRSNAERALTCLPSQRQCTFCLAAMPRKRTRYEERTGFGRLPVNRCPCYLFLHLAPQQEPPTANSEFSRLPACSTLTVYTTYVGKR